MSVSHKQILRITEGANGATVLHLQDDQTAVMTASWIASNRPEVGGYLIDNGRGEVWFAKNGLSTLPAVLVEVQRIAAKPDELILFSLPAGASFEQGARLSAAIKSMAPGLRFLVVSGDPVEVKVISAEQAPICSQSLHADGKPAPADCARCGLLGPCTEKIGEFHP